MPDPVDLAPLVTPAAVTPQEALEYFRAKGFAPPDSRFDYRDWHGASHARGFVVAKAMQDDLLRTLRDAVDKAIAEGRTLEQFRTDLEPELKRQGWWGSKTMTDPATGEQRTVQLGSARRLRVIFDTNMRTSYAAGRWVRIQRTKSALPYLQYIQLQRVNARDDHKPFHELVIPVDHPFWATHFPPNGWFCACATRQMTAAAVERQGLSVTTDPPMGTRAWTNPRTGQIDQVPEGITPGFDTNPGATFLAEQGRYEAIATGLTAQARGVESALIAQARARGIRTGVEHLAAMDIDPADTRAIGGAGSAAPVEWVSGERGGVKLSETLKAIVADPVRQISVVHNHPDSPGLSITDLEMLEFSPGLVRVIAVGHDGSLYRASNPRRGLGFTAGRIWQLANIQITEEVADLDMDAQAMKRLAEHAASTALDRAGYVDYAYAIAGGSRVNLMRFGEERFERIITELLKWPGL